MKAKTLRPYISLDLETTGLDNTKSKVIQVSMVLDDGRAMGGLTESTFFVKHSVIEYSEPYALGMNGWIFKQITGQEDAKYPVLTPEKAAVTISQFLKVGAIAAHQWDTENGVARPKHKIQLAGKNVASFDWPLLLANFPELKTTNYVDHRFLDVGAEFAPLFGYNPGLNTINKLIDYKEVTHDALEDAMNVVAARRWLLNSGRK